MWRWGRLKCWLRSECDSWTLQVLVRMWQLDVTSFGPNVTVGRYNFWSECDSWTLQFLVRMWQLDVTIFGSNVTVGRYNFWSECDSWTLQVLVRMWQLDVTSFGPNVTVGRYNFWSECDSWTLQFLVRMWQLDVTSFGPNVTVGRYNFPTIKADFLNEMLNLQFSVNSASVRQELLWCCRLFTYSVLNSALIHTRCAVKGLFTLVRQKFGPRRSLSKIIFRQYSAKIKLISKYGSHILPYKYFICVRFCRLAWHTRISLSHLSTLQHACAA